MEHLREAIESLIHTLDNLTDVAYKDKKRLDDLEQRVKELEKEREL